MNGTEDAGFWKWLFGIGTSVVAAAWGAVKYVEAKIEKKADKAVVDNQRGDIKELYERTDTLKATLNEELREIGNQINQVEKSTIRLEEQMLRYSSDIESEKRTRAEVNRLMNDKLDTITRTLEQRRTPR